MSKLKPEEFPARALITGLRAIGYSFSTAVADIIDNSISAEATKIDIYFDPLADIPYFGFLDNGYGMNGSELNNAMLLGSDRSNKVDCEEELGRFGLGLKSASLSQCREFIVVSKKNSQINAMSFDLDVIEKENRLYLKILDDSEIDSLPIINKLKTYTTGTLVIWEKFDKIESTAKSFEDGFRHLVAEAKKHVELVFHRFYDSIEIFFNNKKIEKRDPFLLDSHGRQQTGRTSVINVDGSEITVTPYTLPYANTLTADERDLLGNPKSIYDEQGFYIYRNKRLIAWGNWMRMGIRSELNKLARIKVDIPSSLDEVWTLDVKKSSAKIPDIIKDRIKMSVVDSIVRSRRTTRFPGVKEQTAQLKIWERISEHEGKISYQINRDAPAISTLLNILGDNEKELFEIVLSQIEAYLPKYSISNDSSDESVTITNTGDDFEEEKLIQDIENIIGFCDETQKAEMFERIFFAESFQKLYGKKDEIRRRIFGNE